MGVIIKQSIKGTIWSYVGILIGFITTTILYTRFLTTEIVGLISLLLTYSVVIADFFLLGFQSVTSRLFPYFRNSKNHHNGFFFIGMMFVLLGYLIFLVLFTYFKPIIIEANIEKSLLLSKYISLYLPLVFTTMLFFFLNRYNQMLYDAVSGIFFSEFIQRVLIFFSILIYGFGFFNLTQFLWSIVIVISFKAFAILIVLVIKKEINLRPKLKLLNKKLKKEIVSVSLFSLFNSTADILVFSLDKLFVNKFLGLGYTGIYSIAFYFGSLVAIPSRSILNISETFLTEALKNKDYKKIEELFHKSCLTQFIIGSFLFLTIWSNIDSILWILGKEYAQAKWVVFFSGLGYLINMLAGINNSIINFSKYYKYQILFISILAITTIALFYIFIPLFGIAGAAMAAACSLLINNLIKFLFVYSKFKFQPYTQKFLFVSAFYIVLYFIMYFTPNIHPLINILIKELILAVICIIFFKFFKINPEITELINKGLKLFSKKRIK